MLEDPPCLVTCFVEGRAADLRGAARAGRARRGGRAGCARSTTRASSCRREFHVYEVVRDYAEVARSRGGALPDEFEREPRARRRDRRRPSRDHPEHQPGPNHDDLLAANFLQSTHGIVIVDWEYAGMGDPFFDLGNFAVNNELDDDDAERLLEAYFGEPATPRRSAGAQAVPLHVGLPRGDVGRRAERPCRSSTSTSPSTPTSTSSGSTETGADPRFRTWLEEARGG